MALFPELAQWGDKGYYSTDPSTWGFTSGVGSISRSSTYFIGSPSGFSLRFKANDAPFGGSSYFFNTEVQQRATLVAGKTYHIRLMVYTPSTDLIADNGVVFTLVPDAGIPGEISSANTSVSTATNNWSLVELKITAQSSGNHIFNLYLKRFNLVDDINLNASFYVDHFFISEYVEEAPDPCTLEIDVAGTVITDETAPGAGDGSITVATTGGTGPFEYSKNNGSSWQPSNVFSGLDDGIYQVKVREIATPSCESAQSFAVNEATLSFDFTTIVTHESVSGVSDGAIAVTVSGTGGPFTYSKDGGSNYQGGNVFSGLAGGTYTIVVKDASDNVVVKNVIVNPGTVLFEKVYFSKNPITHSIGAQSGYGALTNYRGYNDVRVEDVADSGTFVSKLKMELEPDATALLNFRLRQAFRGVLTATPPTLNNGAITRLTDRIKLYRNFTGHLQDDEVTPASLTTGNPFLVLMGGIGKVNFPMLNYFTSYLPTNKKFMTWAPVEKYVDTLQEDYLNFWIYALAITSIKLRIKAYYDDTTTATSTLITKAPVVYGQLYQIPTGPSNSGVKTITPEKNLVKYEVWLLDQSDAVISEVRTYIIDEVSYPNRRFFMFLNSLGAYEVLRFYGQSDITAKIEKNVIQKHLPADYSTSQGEFETNSAVIRDEASHASGYFEGKYAAAWQEYMKDFMISTRVFELNGAIRKPVNILSDSFQYKIDNDYKHFVRFKALDAYQDDSFTPATV